jgi:Hemerythrin HHE cation binding domain
MENEPSGLLLAHRAMLRDLDRLAELTASLATPGPASGPAAGPASGPVGSPAGGSVRAAAGGTVLGRRRAAAIAGYLSDLCDSIHHHHSAEDDVLWPVLERSAGAHVDLTELTDDHAVLDPKLAAIRAGAAALRTRRTVSADLAADVADLRDTLHEHIADEERTIVPLIKRYVSDREWAEVEAAIRRRGAKMSFEVPRILAVAEPAELAEARREGGIPVAVMIKLMPIPFRRRERLVFAGR